MKACLTWILIWFASAAYGQRADYIHKITKAEYNSISKGIKTYPYNPRYSLRLKASGCSYEIYINDMLVDFDFGASNNTGIIPFPELINKSGLQKIRLHVLPKLNELSTFENAISSEAVLEIEVFHEEYGKFEKTTVLKLALPPIGDNTPILDVERVFDAKVPYVLKDWNDGVDLAKEDPDKLLAEVIDVFQRYRKAFEDKDVATIANMTYERQKLSAQAWQVTSNRTNSYDHGWEQLEKKVDDLKVMYPISEFSMRIMGNGKVVTLLKTTGRLRNFPVVYGETHEEKLRFYGIELYRPKPGAPLEVIR